MWIILYVIRERNLKLNSRSLLGHVFLVGDFHCLIHLNFLIFAVFSHLFSCQRIISLQLQWFSCISFLLEQLSLQNTYFLFPIYSGLCSVNLFRTAIFTTISVVWNAQMIHICTHNSLENNFYIFSHIIILTKFP
jgi:hypothetical protein